MTAVSTQLPINAIAYECVFPTEGEKTTRKYTANKIKPDDRTLLGLLANGTTKVAADSYACIGRSLRLLTPHLPHEVAHWTDFASTVTMKARSGLALANMPRVWKAFKEKITVRTTLDLISTSCHATALFIKDVLSKTISSIGSMFKALLDSYDLVETFKKFFSTRELCKIAEADNNVSAEVKSALNSEWYEQVFKIIKYATAAIAGLITAFVFCSGMVLPLAVGVAILAGTLVSSIFSVAAEYVRQNADYVEYKA